MANKKISFYVGEDEGQRHHAPVADGVKANGLIFLGALRGVDPATRKVPEDTEVEARRLFENMRVALEAGGATFADVVKVAVYMTNLQRDRPIFNQVWKDYFGDEPPARFAVQVMDMGGEPSKFLADVTAVQP